MQSSDLYDMMCVMDWGPSYTNTYVVSSRKQQTRDVILLCSAVNVVKAVSESYGMKQKTHLQSRRVTTKGKDAPRRISQYLKTSWIPRQVMGTAGGSKYAVIDAVNRINKPLVKGGGRQLTLCVVCARPSALRWNKPLLSNFTNSELLITA